MSELLDCGRLFVPADVFAAVRDDALAQPEGHECGGWLLVRDGRAVAYQRSENATTEPGVFAYPDGDVEPLVADADWLLCHSHPRHSFFDGPDWFPSVADLESARSVDADLTAIYSVRFDELVIWRLTEDGYERVPARVEKPRRRTARARR